MSDVAGDRLKVNDSVPSKMLSTTVAILSTRLLFSTDCCVSRMKSSLIAAKFVRHVQILNYYPGVVGNSFCI